MNKVYYAKSTTRILKRVLSEKFKIVSDKQSNGYKFMNAMYGIEVDSLHSYKDQAVHYTSFENFDYGLDYKYSEVSIPEIITSGYIIGDNYIPIKITNNSEFYDGRATRLIEKDPIILNGLSISGIIGVEYMRTDREGDGLIYLNLSGNIIELYNQDISQSYKIPIDDLLNIDTAAISGFNPSIKTKSYDETGNIEYFNTILEDANRRKYPFTKTVYLPKDGDKLKPNAPYVVDFYEPEQYYWDSILNTYKPILYTTDTYLDENNNEKYFRVALNNPNGTGIYNVNVFDLEEVPISGTVKIYDVDNINTNNTVIEIPNTGKQSYIYNQSGIFYIGYDQIVPSYITRESGLIADPYKYTTWEYVSVDDGLENFDWVKHPESNIDNRIRIINPISRYYAEYKTTTSKINGAITTTTANRYVKYDGGEHIYSTLNTNNNLQIIPNSLSKERDGKIGITFDGYDVRPGTIIDAISITSNLVETYTSDSSKTSYLGIPKIAGYTDTIIPDIKDANIYLLNHNIDNIIMYPNIGSVSKSYITDDIGQLILPSNGGINVSKFYRLDSPVQTGNTVIRIKYNSILKNNYSIIESHDPVYGWQIKVGLDGFIYISDTLSMYKLDTTLDLVGKNIDMMLVYNYKYGAEIKVDKYILYISIDGGFHKRYKLYEMTNKKFETNQTNYTVVFPGVPAVVSSVQIYREGSI